MLALCSASSAFARPGRQQLATRGASVRMATNPGEVWESYKAVVAASTEYKAMPSVDSALALCRVAATSREADPDTVCEAMLTVEKGMRDTAKADGGELSRSTLQSLDGAWRLVFTTGTVEMQSKLGRKVDYFPLRATQTFDTRTNAITNGIYVGSFALVRFFGSFEWRSSVLTRAPRGLRAVRTGYAYQPPAYRTYLRHRAAGAPRHARRTRTSLIPRTQALPRTVWCTAGSRSAGASSSTSIASLCSGCPPSTCPRAAPRSWALRLASVPRATSSARRRARR